MRREILVLASLLMSSAPCREMLVDREGVAGNEGYPHPRYFLRKSAETIENRGVERFERAKERGKSVQADENA
jgi:hypothetical protein